MVTTYIGFSSHIAGTKPLIELKMCQRDFLVLRGVATMTTKDTSTGKAGHDKLT